jgi:ABC-type transport system involved in multi-copper enzyme maturation permease subunit
MQMYKCIWLKDLKTEAYTWKSLAWLLVTSIIFSVTTYLMLTNRELSLLDQTEMLWLFSKIIIGSTLLVVIIDASSLITSEFEYETIENLFLTPLSLKDFVLGKLLASFTLWALVFVVALPYMIATSSGSSVTGAFLGYTAFFGILAVLGFTLFVFAVSFLYRSMKDTLTTSLALFLALSIPALFSSTLKNNTLARIFGIVNPLDNIFSGLDNILVDYQTSPGQNLKFIIPLIVFCAAMLVILIFSIRVFRRKGIIKG